MKPGEKGVTRLRTLGVLFVLAYLAVYLGVSRRPVGPPLGPLQATNRGASLASLSPESSARAAERGGSAADPSMGKPPVRRSVSGRVVQTSDYCGGIKPPEDVLESLRKEKPFPNKKLHIRSGSVNQASRAVLQSLAADAEGNFKIELPPGAYCVVGEEKKAEPKLVPVAKEDPRETASREQCLRKWYGACDKVLKVADRDLKDVVIKFHHACHPPCAPPGPPVP